MTLLSSDISRSKALLESGQLVAIPTETVYGLAANAFDESAVRRIFEVKNRPFYDPLILHTDSISKIEQWGMHIPEQLHKLADRFWPGPLTLLIDKSDMVPDLITAGLPRVAIRIPNLSITRSLLAELSFPLAAPSANPFGYVSPTTPEDVLQHFDGKISMVLDGGRCEVGIESTIVGLENNELCIYRVGGLALEQIERISGPCIVKTSSSQPAAPGMLERHYSPKRPVIAVNDQAQLDAFAGGMVNAYIVYKFTPPTDDESLIARLSANHSPDEAAHNFYRALMQWEKDDRVHQIIVERMPDFGLGRAINDRLKRAARE